MRYYLFLLIVAICEAGVITSSTGYGNLHAVYHGHGATSYQNVQIDNHDSILVPANYGDQAELVALRHHIYHQPIISIVEPHNIDDIDDIDIAHSAPYEEFILTDVKPDIENYFDHYDEKHDYDLHL